MPIVRPGKKQQAEEQEAAIAPASLAAAMAMGARQQVEEASTQPAPVLGEQSAVTPAQEVPRQQRVVEVAEAPTIPRAGDPSRLRLVERKLNTLFIERHEAVRALVLALGAKEHVVMVGPPGTAKTSMALALARLVSASWYSYQLNRFTDYSEIFGPIDIAALVEGRVERRWSRIVEAEIVFLDEVFKASPAILNSLLSMMQERVVYDPMTGGQRPVRLWTLIGASNEVPVEEELRAFYDRFAVRVFIDYLRGDEEAKKALAARWSGRWIEDLTPVATMEDVKAFHGRVLELVRGVLDGRRFVERYYDEVGQLVKELRGRGVPVSDRTLVEKLPKLVAAYMLLENAVSPDGLIEAGVYVSRYLAATREQLKEVEKVIEDVTGELSEIERRLRDAVAAVEAGDVGRARQLLSEVVSMDLSRLRGWARRRAEALVSRASIVLKRIEEYERRIAEAVREEAVQL